MNDPVAPPPPPPADPRGSLLAGFFLTWAALIGGSIVSGVLMSLNLRDANLILLLFSLPWVLIIGLIVWLAKTGKTRTANGMLIGIASVVAVGLLLVAACFTLLAGTTFH